MQASRPMQSWRHLHQINVELEGIVDTNHLIDLFAYPGLFVAIMLGSFGLPLPEAATLLLCGYLISQGVILPVPGIAVVLTCIIASDLLVFILGKLYGHRLLHHRLFHRFFSIDRLSCLEDGFAKIAPFLIIFGRHFFGLRTNIVFMSAITGMPARRFLLVDSVAASISVAVMVFIGYSGGNWIRSSVPENVSSAYPIALALAATASGALFRHVASRKKKCQANDACPPQVQGHSVIDH